MASLSSTNCSHLDLRLISESQNVLGSKQGHFAEVASCRRFTLVKLFSTRSRGFCFNNPWVSGEFADHSKLAKVLFPQEKVGSTRRSQQSRVCAVATWKTGETSEPLKNPSQSKLQLSNRTAFVRNSLDQQMKLRGKHSLKAAGTAGEQSTSVPDGRIPVTVDTASSRIRLEEAIGFSIPEVYTIFTAKDFAISPHVSVGLHGRSDELLYEGVVQKESSPLRGMRVVLRRLTGPRALRWGQRALQAMPRLLRGEEWHHPYTTRLHGFIPPESEDDQSLTLVHGYYGSYSLHQWLLCSDWLPLLEARLALDEEAMRRVGDERVGGPEMMRCLRVIRMVLRDFLIGVNYVHSRGMAHLDLRLQNAHISAADRHVKVGVLGKAVDFPQEVSGGLSLRHRMIASDIRSVGVMMAQMVLRELMHPTTAILFKNFLKQGHNPSSLREYLHPMVRTEHPLESPGMQILDLDGGAGWNLLAAMLDPRPEKRISCQDALRHPFLCGPRWRRGEASPDLLRWAVGSAAVRIAEEFIYLPDQRQRLQQLITILEKIKEPVTLPVWNRLGGGSWKLVYHTGRYIGPTLRQASPAVRIGSVLMTLVPSNTTPHPMKVDVSFTVMPLKGNWPADKSGIKGLLKLRCGKVDVRPGAQMLISQGGEEGGEEGGQAGPKTQTGRDVRRSQRPAWARGRDPRNRGRGGKAGTPSQANARGEFASEGSRQSIPVLGFSVDDVELGLELDYKRNANEIVQGVLREVRLQLPKELFDLSGLACISSLDGRFLVFKGVTGASLLFTRSPRS